MNSKGKGVQVEGSSSYGTNDAYMETATDSPVDLSLRLGPPATEANNLRQGDPVHPSNINLKSSMTTPVIHSSGLMNMNSSLASPIHVNAPRPYSYGNASNLAYEFPSSSVPQLSNYCVINTSSKRAKTGGSRKRKSGSRPAKQEYRTCTNYNCRVTQSPMWRNGPFGPKTLCNRCGIRFRKMKTGEENG